MTAGVPDSSSMVVPFRRAMGHDERDWHHMPLATPRGPSRPPCQLTIPSTMPEKTHNRHGPNCAGRQVSTPHHPLPLHIWSFCSNIKLPPISNLTGSRTTPPVSSNSNGNQLIPCLLLTRTSVCNHMMLTLPPHETMASD